MALTQRQLEVLQEMAAARREGNFEEAEIVSEGMASCYLGFRRVSGRTLAALIDHGLVSTDDTSGFRRWAINGTGLTVAARPELADQVWLALRTGKSFSVTDRGVVLL